MKWDKSTLGGLVLAVGGILAGLFFEGGKIAQVLQPTAAMIVFGGTLGAVMVQFPLPVVLEAARRLRSIFLEDPADPRKLIRELVTCAFKARRTGLISLDSELEKVRDPFMKKVLMLAIDGTNSSELRSMIELELDSQAEAAERIPRVYEAAGGFAPTVGIIGAILGLIQVMQHLENINEVGTGIAVAFVATIYGVGSANLFFLPSAGKLKLRIREEALRSELILEGVISILEGMNPRLIETKLTGFLQQKQREDPALVTKQFRQHAGETSIPVKEAAGL
jgi:chemotaxis protein MotA